MTDGPGPVDAVADLTPEWLAAALGVRAAVVASEPIGHGQIGSNHRLQLEGDGVPATLVAKLGAGEDRSIVAGGYRKEVAFYRDLADTVAVRTPRCWHASINEDGTVFTLLLEDLAPAEPGDQLAGCGPAEADAVIRNLAGLHGPRWCDPTLWDHPELDAPDADGAAFLGEIFTSAVDTFVERYRDDLADADAPLLRELAAAIPTWLLTRSDRFALLHGDHRLDNLLFGPSGEVTAVDWQTLTVGHPGRDLAYFCETSLTPEVRRGCEQDVVEAYREALAGFGVEVTSEDAWGDHRLGLLQGPLITVLGAVYATAGRSERSDAMFLTMLSRALTAIRDLQPLELL